MVSVKINGVSVEVASQLTLNKNRKENADSGALKILSNREARYEPYSIVDINDNEGNTYQMVIESDSVLTYKNSLYEHEITLIESIAILSTIYPVDRSFTSVPSKSIKDILNIYKKELEYYQQFNFIFDDTDDLYDELMVNKEYASVNMAEIVYDLFRTINAIPRIKYDNGIWSLSYELYITRGSELTLDVESEQKDVNDIDYATDVIHKSRNVSIEDNGVWYPSKDKFVTPRISGTIIKTSELEYQLDSNIEVLYKVEAETEIQMQESWIIENPAEDTTKKVIVDITNRVKEKDEFDALTINGNYDPINYSPYDNQNKAPFYKENCITYTKGSNIVDNLFTVSDTFTLFTQNIRHLRNAILAELKDAIDELEAPYDDLGYIEFKDDDDYRYSPENITEDIKLRFYYRPERDVDFVTQRQDTENFNKATILNNQKDTRVDLSKLIENSNIYVNRIGSQVVGLTQSFDIDEAYWKLGDYYLLDNEYWLAVDIDYTFDRTNVVCRADFVKNFANTDRETSTFRDPSPYVFTGKRLQSNFILKEHLVFGDSDYNDDSILSDNAKRTVMNIFDFDNTYNDPIRDMIYRRSVDNKYIHMPALVNGSGNTLLVHSAFKSPQIGGNALRKISNSWYKDPVLYTEEDTFTVNNAYVNLQNGYKELVDTSTYKYYPLVDNDTSLYKTDGYTMPIDKDTNDSLAITWQLLIKSNDKRVIVPNGFAKLNNLIKEYDTTPLLQIYTRATPYSILDKKVTDDDTATTGTVELDMTTGTITVQDALDDAFDYWALGIGTELILCGNNGIKEVPFTFTKYISYQEYYIDSVELYLDDNLEFLMSANLTFEEALRDLVSNLGFTLSADVDYIIPPKLFINEELDFNLSANVLKLEVEKLDVVEAVRFELDANVIYAPVEKLFLQESVGFNLSSILNHYLESEVYTITYVLNGGVNDPDNPDRFISSDLNIALQDPTKTDRTFDGWYTDAAFNNENNSITTAVDSTRYARWLVKAWDSLGNSSDPDYLIYDYSVRKTQPQIPPSVTGYNVGDIVRTNETGGTFYYWFQVVLEDE